MSAAVGAEACLVPPAHSGPADSQPSPVIGLPSNKKNRKKKSKRSNRKSDEHHIEGTDLSECAEYPMPTTPKDRRNRSSGSQCSQAKTQSKNIERTNALEDVGEAVVKKPGKTPRRGRGFQDRHHSGQSPAGSPARTDDLGQRQHSGKRSGRGRGGSHNQHQNQGRSSPLNVTNQPEYRRQYSGGPDGPQSPGMYSSGPYSPYTMYGPNPYFQCHSPQPGYVPWFYDPRFYNSSQQEPRFHAQMVNGNANHSNQTQKQRKPQQHQHHKKNLFEKYMSSEDVSHKLKRGELIQGVLRINPKNYEDCYIPHPDGLSDVYISGLKDRNRALNGDLIAVQMYPREEWKVQVDLIDVDEQAITQELKSLKLDPNGSSCPRPTAKAENRGASEQAQGASARQTCDASVNTPTVDKLQVSTPVTQTEAKVTPSCGQGSDKPGHSSKNKSKGQETPRKRFTTLKEYASTPEIKRVTKKLFDDKKGEAQVEEKKNDKKNEMDEEEVKERMDAVPIKALTRTGKIVAIIEQKNSRAATGHIRLMADGNNHTALFIPSDRRFPFMMIPMENCPKDFHVRPDDHKQTLFVARLTKWEENSKYARGKLARSLGEAGEIEPETEGILLSYDVDYSEFSDEALKCLPQNLPWRIPESEFSYRKDLRNECVFTIDPATARDLDDALHVKHMGDGVYEVGVHIADVSFFLEEDTALDAIASQRSTSVYLVQKVIPMLPRLLCEELCSLNPGEERLTFSVIWKMTEKGDILDEWFGRTIIKSCIKMSYDHAQGFIEQPERQWTKEELPQITGNFSVSLLVEKVLQLQAIAKNMRKKRFDDGALRLDQVKLSFTLDKETGMPNGFYVYQQRDSNKLIEEFMLLANMAVAHKIYKTFPEEAVLRRHPPPQSKMMDDLTRTCSSLGVPMDIRSSKKIHESIQAIMGETLEEQARAQILTVLCSKPMQNAKYFCTGMLEDEYEYRHYALNVPLYTHFTSPIRRYPDVMVHRLLAAVLGYHKLPSTQKEAIQRQCDHSNDKKTNSKRVQELSSELFFAVFVKECGPLEERGMVMGVLDKSFDVLVLSLGVVKRVYCEKLPLKDYGFMKQQKRPILRLIWEATNEHPQTVEQDLSIFSLVNCVLTADDEPLKYTAIVKHPQDSGLLD